MCCRRSGPTRSIALSVAALPLVAAAIGLACGDGGPNHVDATLADSVPGVWAYREVIADASQGISCHDTGLLYVVQDGLAFDATVEQTGTCDTPSGPRDNSGSARFQGSVGDGRIRFSFAGCTYVGRLFGVPPDSMDGSVRCTGQPPFDLTGHWSGGRPFVPEPLSLTGSVTPPVGDVVLVTGETMELSVTARTNLPITWIGYRLGPPANTQDSVARSDSVVSAVFQSSVQASWEGTAGVTLFARDSLGRVQESLVDVGFLDAIRRPVDTTTLTAPATTLVEDRGRNGLYLFQPSLNRVAFFDLALFSVGHTYPFTLPAGHSMAGDITHGGDSLAIVTGSDSLVFLNLVTGGTGSVRILPDAGTTETVMLRSVKLTSNNKAFVFGQRASQGFIYVSLWEYDIATGAQRRVTEVGINGAVGLTSDFERSPDGSHVLLLDGVNSCTSIYSAAASSFGPCRQPGSLIQSFPVASETGSRWLLRGKLFDEAFNPLPDVLPVDPGPGAISPDGSVAYYPTLFGYQKVRVSDGQLLEKVRLPGATTLRVATIQGGLGLMVWNTTVGGIPYLVGTDRITVVDLR